MKQRIYDTCLGFNELEDERKMVNQQVIGPLDVEAELLRMKRLIKNFLGDILSIKKVVNYSD